MKILAQMMNPSVLSFDDALHPSQQFFSYVGMFSCLSGLKSTKQRITCLVQGHNTVPPVSIKLATCDFDPKSNT